MEYEEILPRRWRRRRIMESGGERYKMRENERKKGTKKDL